MPSPSSTKSIITAQAPVAEITTPPNLTTLASDSMIVNPHEVSLSESSSPSSTHSLAPEFDIKNTEDPSSRPYSIYSDWGKFFIIVGASSAAFFSPMTQQIYFPALTNIADDFHISDTEANLTISTYMIFQGLTPIFLGNFADSAGRRPAYMICFVIYIAANIGLALAPNYGAMLALRCVQAAGSSSTVAMSFAVVSDVITSAERGKYVGTTSLPIVLAPALGPVVGGLIAQYLNWRAIFWFLSILAGVFIVPFFIMMPETARSLAGDGSKIPPRLNQTGLHLITSFRRARKNKENPETLEVVPEDPPSCKLQWPNPMPSLRLIFDKEHSLILLSNTAVFAGFYMLTSSIPSQFSEHYGYNQAQTGLVYLPLAAGSTLASYGLGFVMDLNYRRHCEKHGRPYEKAKQESMDGFPIERIRYEVGLPLLLLAALGQIAWGWALHQRAHISIICVLIFVLGVGIIGFNNITNAMITDINRTKAASAAATNNLTRCLIGAGATAAIVPLISKIGTGWTFTLVGGMYFLTVIPTFIIIMHGVKWREEKAKKRKLVKKMGANEDAVDVNESKVEIATREIV